MSPARVGLGFLLALTGPAWSKPETKGEPPLPVLRTGERRVHTAPAAEVRLRGRYRGEREEILELAISSPSLRAWDDRGVVAVEPAPGAAPPFAFLEGPARAAPEGEAVLWISRAREQVGPVKGAVVLAPPPDQPGESERIPFQVPPGEAKDDPSVRARFAEAAGRYFGSRRGGTPFYAFASARLRSGRAAPQEDLTAARRRAQDGELEQLMDTTTGMTSIQEALQNDRPLVLAAGTERAQIPLSAVTPPELRVHPFPELLKQLGRTPPDEPLAAATPADFYYLRAKELTLLFRLIDQADAWVTPAAQVLERGGEDRGLERRYLTQLGLDRGPLARAVGPAVVGELAVVGSDPYVREGTDLTVIFRVKARGLFDAALKAQLAEHGRTHPLTESTLDADGVSVRVARSEDQAVRQHRATLGDLELVSNSAAAIRRVLAAAARRAPRLSDEPDLRYFLARDRDVRTDAFAFLGDRFVASVVGPRQKILEARRQLHLAELLRPGYAAMLFGWMTGRSPRSLDELVAAGYLARADLAHADGEPIRFAPGQPARSRWGTPGMLEPLLELPPLDRVTAAEQAGYARFARAYQRSWREYIDPIALRVAALPRPGGVRLEAALRVMPLLDSTDYHKLERQIGRAHATAPSPPTGLRVTLGVGADSELRRELRSVLSSGILGHRLEIDWLGEWALLGVEETPLLAEVARDQAPRQVPERPRDPGERAEPGRESVVDRALNLPIYAGVAIRNPVAATVLLAGLRKSLLDAAPGRFEWREAGSYHGAHLTRIAVPPDPGQTSRPALYYTLWKGALLLSLSEPTLKRLIDEQAGTRGTAAAAADGPGAAQFFVEAAGRRGGALRTLLGWMLEARALAGAESSRARAEAILRGAPELAADAEKVRQLALAYEGLEAVAPDGGRYTLGSEGPIDPARGTPTAWRWLPLPVAGSPVARLVAALGRFRAGLALEEGPQVGGVRMRGLSVRATLELDE